MFYHWCKSRIIDPYYCKYIILLHDEFGLLLCTNLYHIHRLRLDRLCRPSWFIFTKFSLWIIGIYVRWLEYMRYVGYFLTNCHLFSIFGIQRMERSTSRSHWWSRRWVDARHGRRWWKITATIVAKRQRWRCRNHKL